MIAPLLLGPLLSEAGLLAALTYQHPKPRIYF